MENHVDILLYLLWVYYSRFVGREEKSKGYWIELYSYFLLGFLLEIFSGQKPFFG